MEFFSTQAAAAQVNDDGRVVAVGYGSTRILARVDGVISNNATQVSAGRFNLRPAILYLDLAQSPTGTLALQLENADGTPVSLADKTVEFATSSPIVTVSNDGSVTALRPPATFNDTPYIRVWVDGVVADNATVVRVTEEPLGLDLLELTGEHVVFEIARRVGEFDYEQIFTDFDVLRTTDLGYTFEAELTGTLPFNGVQYMVHEVGFDPGNTVPCGLSGNPARFGTILDQPIHNSCLIVGVAPADPQWGPIFHEIGHNFTFASQRFGAFVFAHSDNAYSEGLATAVYLYVVQRLRSDGASSGLPEAALQNVARTFDNGNNFRGNLETYVEPGADYAQLDPNVVDGILVALIDTYGVEFLYRLFSGFLPADASLGVALTSDTEVATYFVALASAAARTDLRTQFRDAWGFPIDNAFYDAVFPAVADAVAQRDPRARIRAETDVAVGTVVTLDGAGSYDPQGRSLRFAWTLTEAPPAETRFAPLAPNWNLLGWTGATAVAEATASIADAIDAIYAYDAPPSGSRCSGRPASHSSIPWTISIPATASGSRRPAVSNGCSRTACASPGKFRSWKDSTSNRGRDRTAPARPRLSRTSGTRSGRPSFGTRLPSGPAVLARRTGLPERPGHAPVRRWGVARDGSARDVDPAGGRPQRCRALDPTASAPTLVLDALGRYTVTLEVHNGVVPSEVAAITFDAVIAGP